jgi:hypothetical protein
MILLQSRFEAQPNATLFVANQLIDTRPFDIQGAARRFSNGETSQHHLSGPCLNAIQSCALQPPAYLIDKTALAVTADVVAESLHYYLR